MNQPRIVFRSKALVSCVRPWPDSLRQRHILVTAGFTAGDPEALAGFAPLLFEHGICVEAGSGVDGDGHGRGGLNLGDFDFKVGIEVLGFVIENLLPRFICRLPGKRSNAVDPLITLLR